MGRGSISRGNLFAQNIQAGSVTLTLGGTGTDTTSVSFARAMKGIPVVVPAVNSDVAITECRAYNASRTGFTLKVVNGDSLTSECIVGYQAFDDAYF
jgi:aspartate-semialdehyde dehydrogenase